ncbi:hypothetical protein M0805_002854 [Coniferiporia weirii]|nr:hypothetical protein M0805_002854 [Coniferiporia weirii]
MTTSVDESQFPTELVFSEDSPCNCTITERRTGRVLYTVHSRRDLKTGATPARTELIITIDVYDSARELIVTDVWHGFTADVVTWPARAMYNAKLSVWLKKSMVPFSNVAKFKDDQGRSYKWDTKGIREQYRLLADDGTPIAYFDRANPYVNTQPGYSYNPAPRPSRLLLSSHANAMRDAVVLSFLFLEKDRRRKNMESDRYAYSQALSPFLFNGVS